MRSTFQTRSQASATLETVTARERVLEEAPRWTEDQAAAALRAVERHEGPAARTVDEWGDLDEFSARASSASLRRLDEEEAKAGFSWDHDERR